jgi:hypothetical protein
LLQEKTTSPEETTSLEKTTSSEKLLREELRRIKVDMEILIAENSRLSALSETIHNQLKQMQNHLNTEEVLQQPISVMQIYEVIPCELLGWENPDQGAKYQN